MSDDRIFAGMDVCSDFTQITYFSKKTASPESLSHDQSEEQYLIPTRLALKLAKHEWIIGDDVIEALNEDTEDVEEVEDLLKRVAEGKMITVAGDEFESGHILQIFLRRVFMVLRNYNPYASVEYVVFTSDIVSENFANVLHDALARFGIDKDRHAFISHEEAFIDYTIHQRREMWMNETALFEIGDSGLNVSFLSISKDTDPMAADIEKKVYDELTTDMVKNDRIRAAGTFRTLAEAAMLDKNISTIYAVGRGFITDFADEELGNLSTGRNVFRGQNLFAKGACYLAHAKSRGENEKFIFFDDERIRTGISVMVEDNGRQAEAVLVEPAKLWFDAECDRDIIVQSEEELTFQRKDFITKKVERRFISLAGLEAGMDGLTRLRISVRFASRDVCIIRVKDMGFGTFVPTTNRVWEIRWEK